MQAGTRSALKPMGPARSLAIYLPAALLLWTVTRYVIPYLSRRTGREAVLFWFLVGGAGVFLPLLLAALAILRREGRGLTGDTWRRRLRFRRLTRADWMWSLAGLACAAGLSAVAIKGLESLTGPFAPSPAFLAFEPLTAGRYWLLAIWVPFWILNIMGEEILWRGVMLPRQQAGLGSRAWLVNSAGWALFHAAFGWRLLVTMVPIMLLLPLIAGKRRNSWTGVIMHAGINGPVFLAIAFGML